MNAKRFVLGFVIGLVLLFAVGCNANEVGTVSTVILMIKGIIPFVTGLGAAIDPGEASIINSASGMAVTALSAVQAALQEYQSQPNDTTLAALQAAMNTSHDQLASLLAAAQVKNPTTLTRITAIVNAAVAAISGVEAIVLAKHPASVAAASVTTP